MHKPLQGCWTAYPLRILQNCWKGGGTSQSPPPNDATTASHCDCIDVEFCRAIINSRTGSIPSSSLFSDCPTFLDPIFRNSSFIGGKCLSGFFFIKAVFFLGTLFVRGGKDFSASLSSPKLAMVAAMLTSHQPSRASWPSVGFVPPSSVPLPWEP